MLHRNKKREATPIENQKRIPRLCIASWIATGVCGLLVLLFRLFPAFADFFNRYISQPLRLVFGLITSIFPFSLAEMMLILSPVLLTLLIVLGVRKHAKTWKSAGMYLCKIFSAVLVFFILFVSNFAAGYYGVPLNDETKLDLDRQNSSAEELYQTALHLAEQVNREAMNVTFKEKDFSIMPYRRSEMNRHLLDAYDTFCEEHDFIGHFYSRAKPVLLSEAMSYTHITGVYSYFTGEANLNVNFPDYTLPYTAAHELAHQRGIAREDEANFMAFLVCTASEDPYFRYCGYLNLYEYVASALYSADSERYFAVLDTVDYRMRGELIAYSEFFDQYRENVVSEVSGAINDTYLKLQGTEGSKSYGRVVDLAVAWYKALK